jgi:very-short-patch-repair endonuclease
LAVFCLIEYIVFFGLLSAGVLAYFAFSYGGKTAKTLFDPRNKCESYIERRLYDALTSRGYSVTTQVVCGKYRIDLVLMGPRIAIECDGKDYHSSPEQKAHDRRKNAYLRRKGWKVIRFSGRQINKDLRKVLQRIEEAVR